MAETKPRAAAAEQAAAPIDAQLAGQVYQLYVSESMSIRRIAADLLLPRPAVSAMLRSRGVTVPARGASRPRPHRRLARAPALCETLTELYVRQRLTRAQVAARFGVPESRVRGWLHELDVPVRSRGKGMREDRDRVDKRALLAWYVVAELPADRVAARLGTSRRRVLDSAHELGIPVRPGGSPNNARALAVLPALYEDKEVVSVLHQHSVPIVLSGGPITDRFPTPVPLRAELLAALYVRCGLSAAQIELVTGHPAATIRQRLMAAGIPLRPAGGLAPFTRRARPTAPRHQAATP